MSEYFYNGLLLISIVLIYFAIKQYGNTRNLINSGIKTRASVVDLIKKRSDDGFTYTPVFEYIDGTNGKHIFESSIRSSSPSFKIGDKIDILYSEDNKIQKLISYWGLYRMTLILLSIATPLFIIGGGYLLYTTL